MIRHKYKTVLELDTNSVSDENNLQCLIRNFRADILNSILGLNTNSDIKRLEIEASKHASKTTLIANISVKMTKKDYIRFLCDIYQKYPHDTLRIF